MLRNIKFRTKVSIALLVVGFVPFLFIGIVTLLTSSRALSKQAFGQLQSMRDVKKTQLEKYFEARRTEMGALIESVAILRQAAFDKLATAQEIKKAQVENYFAQHVKNISVLSKSTTVIDALKRFRVAFGSEEEGKVGGELYTFLETLFGESLQRFTEEYGYEDLYLITREGTIVYSVAKQSDEGQNLLTGPLSDSPLAQGFRKGLKGIAFQDFAPYQISDNRYFGFLVAPIVDQVGKDASDFIISGETQQTPKTALSIQDMGGVFGVIALKVSPAMINTIVQRREGMGETGETYLVGIQDGTIVYRSDRVVQYGLIGQEVPYKKLRKAFSGQAGQEIVPGKNDVLEVRSYDPLDLPGLTWGMISAMSLEEAINPRFERKGDYFTRYNQQYGYEDLLLIHPQGEIFYTVAHNADYGTNILTGQYSDSNLSALIRKVLETKQFEITDFALYAPDNNEPSAFIAQPVVNEDKVEVVVALKLSIDSINRMMLERSGMGKTGETYLIGSDRLPRSDTFREPVKHSVREAFMSPTTGRINTIATQSALSGKTGASIIQGYTGKRVLSSYTPVRVGDTVWALIAEIDEAEAFAAIQALKYLMGLLAVVGFGVILSTALVLSRVMITPLTYLARISDQLARGDIACNVEGLRRYGSRDEIGTLAQAFEKLIIYIQEMATVATEIAQGNLSRGIQPRSAKDVLGNAFLNMSAYLNEMAMAASMIASGDLHQDIQPKSEHDVLRNAFQKMAVQLRENFEKIQREIAERKQVQESLAEERNLLRTLIDHLPDFIYVKDTESRFLIANTTLAYFVGATTPDELIGKTDFDFFPTELAEEFYTDDRAVIDLGQTLLNREEPNINQVTGTTNWMLTTKVSFQDSHGTIVGLVGIGRDITERKRIEEALQRLNEELEQRVEARTAELAHANTEIRLLNEQLQVENLRVSANLKESEHKYKILVEEITDGYFVIQDGVIVFANQVFCHLHGYQLEEVLGQPFTVFVDPESRGEVAEIYHKTRQEMAVSHLFEYLRLTKDGRSLSTEMTAKTTRYENKLVDIGICRDITARLQMERRVRDAERMAYIGRITTSLSHEIRNPLSTIKINLQLLAKNHQFADNDRRHIDIAVSEMGRLEGILSEILDFAKPLYPKIIECNINHLLASCLELLQVKFEQKQLAVIRSFAPDIPNIQADEKKLSQAFINLLLNACEASEQEGKLWVSSRYHVDTDNPRVEVIVEDEGGGITKKQLRDIFKPFFTTKPKGTGLGLTNVKRIIETHEGWVEATNRSSRGASFCVHLPVIQKTSGFRSISEY